MTNRPAENMKVPRLVARSMSAIIIGFALLMFIGESFEGRANPNPQPFSGYILFQFGLFGLGMLGLLLAWKWEMKGGLLALLAFITLFIVNPEAFVPAMLIFPANAIIFMGVAYRSGGE